MNRKLCITLALLILLTTISLASPQAYSTTGTTITVNPKKKYAPSGQPSAINVTVSNVINLNAWQLLLAFNPLILNCINITVPQDNIFGSSFILFPPEINNAQGYILAFCVFEGAYPVSGSGVLCQIEFDCLMPGISSLEITRLECPLCSTYLQEPDYDLIPFEAVNGTVVVTEQGFEENFFNATVNEEVYSVLIFSNSTITAFNYDQTWKKITFDTTGTTGTTGSTTVATPKSLLNGTDLMILVDMTPNPYSLSKNATHNFIQFTYQHTTKNIEIFDTILGDVNGDRKVRVDDVLLVALAFGSNKGDPDWDPYADLNGDDKIRVDDVLIAAKEFGKQWAP